MVPRPSSKRGRKPAPDYSAPLKSSPGATKSYASSSSSKSFKSHGVSEQLRQAVKDLGGDDSDLELIAGIDDDDEDETPFAPVKGSTGPTDEKSLRKALGAFMKDLDFHSTAPVEVESEEENDQSSDGDDDGVVSEDGDHEEGKTLNNDEDDDEDDQYDVSSGHEVSDQPVPPPQTRKEQTSKVVDAAASFEEPPMKFKSAMQAQPDASGSAVPAAAIWTSLVPELGPMPSPNPELSQMAFSSLRSRANRLLSSSPELSRSGSSSDAKFISQILQSGTHQDKLSALVLLVRESPVHAVKELERLRAMAGWKEEGGVGGGGGRDERVAVMRALADWWVTGGGKEAGKLRYFADQPLLAHPGITDRHLLVYAFEDFLKKWFFNILQVLEALSHDTLPFVRTQALNMTFQLLSGNAEQEQNLLRLGVNKLGDIDRSVASKASHHLLQLLQAHPAMLAVVAREVSALVLKAPQAPQELEKGKHQRFDKGKAAVPAKVDTTGHGRYYGLITLNQMTLTSKDREVAGRLVEVYFEVFREILGDGSGPEEEAVIADVDGLAEQNKIEKVAGKVEKWRGRRKGTKPKGGRKSALEQEELVETGDAKMVAAVLTGVNRAIPFAKLDDDAFTKYMDTLFKITHAGTFNTSIQALVLIFQVCQSRQAVSDRFYRTLYESLFDGRLVTSSKQAMYLNLLFKALKADTSLQRVMAFVKRLLQMLGMHQPPFICGALYLLGELFAGTPGLKRMLIEPEDDDQEHFVDAPEDSVKAAPVAESSRSRQDEKQYDGRKREPQFANADSSCLWELVPFLNHFHPSVSLQASQLLLSLPLKGSPDISLNTLVSFLDRFVYRNPKKTLQPKGASIMQPSAASDKSGMLVNNKGARSLEEGGGGYVNSEKFWRMKIEEVPVDQLFFHRFFASKLAGKEGRGKKGKKDDEDEKMVESEVEDAVDEEGDEVEVETENADEEGEGDESDSDPEEAEIWKAMKASMPAVNDDMGISEDDDDDDEDLEEDDEEVEDGSEAEDQSDEDDDVELSEAESDEEDVSPTVPKKKGKGKPESDVSESDDFPDFDEDEDDLISLDEMPDIVLTGSPDPAIEEEKEEEDEAVAGKRKRKEERKERKKKRREAPVFGSYEDYAALIEAGGDGDED